MLSGNGDPTVLKSLLRKRFDAAINSIETHRLRAEMGGLEGPIGLQKFARLDAQREKFDAAFSEFERVIDEGSLGRRKETGTAGQLPSGQPTFTPLSREDFSKLSAPERAAYLERARAQGGR